jgi:hypothetical protein
MKEILVILLKSFNIIFIILFCFIVYNIYTNEFQIEIQIQKKIKDENNNNKNLNLYLYLNKNKNKIIKEEKKAKKKINKQKFIFNNDNKIKEFEFQYENNYEIYFKFNKKNITNYKLNEIFFTNKNYFNNNDNVNINFLYLSYNKTKIYLILENIVTYILEIILIQRLTILYIFLIICQDDLFIILNIGVY